MNFNDLKDLCKEHNRILENTKIIERANKNHHWVKALTADREGFYLNDEEIGLLKQYYEKKGLGIETVISDLLSK
jgi:hypothetical protein